MCSRINKSSVLYTAKTMLVRPSVSASELKVVTIIRVGILEGDSGQLIDSGLLSSARCTLFYPISFIYSICDTRIVISTTNT